MDLGEFLDHYHMVRSEEITAEGTDVVQEKAEKALLENLKAEFDKVYATVEEGQFLSIESKSGVDYPRTRYDRTTLGDRPFVYTIDRPLRLGIFEKRVPN